MENIQVFSRVRPRNKYEIEINEQEIWQTSSPTTLRVTPSLQDELPKIKKFGAEKRTEYNFHQCFDKFTTNTLIYNSSIKSLVSSSLGGIDCTIFTYGQTGSGKTFTMMGLGGLGVSYSNPDSQKENASIPKSDILDSSSKFLRSPFMINEERQLERMNTSIKKSPLVVKKGTFTGATGGTTTQFSPAGLKERAQTMNIEGEMSFENNNYEKDDMMMNSIRKVDQNASRANTENSEGMLVLAMRDIFHDIDHQSQKQYFLRVSYLEIYNDNVYDLLKPQENLNDALTICQDLNKGFFIRGASEEAVSSLEDVLQKIRKGEANKHYASTTLNHASSRSHTIFRLYIKAMTIGIDAENGIITESILNFVDLAGSERLEVTDRTKAKKKDFVTGNLTPLDLGFNIQRERIKESQRINKSLFFLTQVISLKSEGKADVVIPYRNSPLTKILKSSLGGNSRTAIILCINPCFSQIDQSLSTLKFGLNAKKIENKIQANVTSNDSSELLKNLLKECEKRIEDLQREKCLDKSTSGALIKAIQHLQDQKNMLLEKLELMRKIELLPNRPIEITKAMVGGGKDTKQGDLYCANVGILHVLTPPEKSDESLEYELEEKQQAYDLLKNAKLQNSLLMERIRVMEENFKRVEKEKDEMAKELQKSQNLMKKKNIWIDNLKRTIRQNRIENDKYQDIVNLYHNKDLEKLKELPNKTLVKIEQNLLTLLDSVKFQKAFRLLNEELLKEDEQEGSSASQNVARLMANIASRPIEKRPYQFDDEGDDLEAEDYEIIHAKSMGYKKIKKDDNENEQVGKAENSTHHHHLPSFGVKLEDNHQEKMVIERKSTEGAMSIENPNSKGHLLRNDDYDEEERRISVKEEDSGEWSARKLTTPTSKRIPESDMKEKTENFLNLLNTHREKLARALGSTEK